MDSNTLGILRKIRDSRCKPSSYIPGFRDLGLPPDAADLYRRGLIDVAEDGLGTPVYVLLSAGREALEAEDARIRDAKPWRRFRRKAGACFAFVTATAASAIISTVVSIVVSAIVARGCAKAILEDFAANGGNGAKNAVADERADADNGGKSG